MSQPNTLFDIAGIQARIFHLPNRPPFMTVFGVAELYSSSPKRINEQVKRNPVRFPERYAFRLTEAEEQEMMTQNASSFGKKRADLRPLVFTHGGANMLASVLRGPVADEMAVAINDAFTEMEMKAIAEANHMLGKLRTDILAKKPIYVRIKDASERGLHIDTLWREANYPKHKLETAVREMVKLGMLDNLLNGMQAGLFDA